MQRWGKVAKMGWLSTDKQQKNGASGGVPPSGYGT
jgi:hypothetical protein